jgi:Lar family restriction alleviation protein
MTRALDCPHCASSDVEVVGVQYEERPALAVHCKECGAIGPHSESPEPAHAIHAWNQRAGRLTVVKLAKSLGVARGGSQ